MEADEARRRALADFTGFTGLHRGAETLVASVPSAGWARGGGATEIAYAERLSASRIRVDPLQHQRRGKKGGVPGEGHRRGEIVVAAGGVDAVHPTNAAGAAIDADLSASGLMLRHRVPAKDVIARGCQENHLG